MDTGTALGALVLIVIICVLTLRAIFRVDDVIKILKNIHEETKLIRKAVEKYDIQTKENEAIYRFFK